MKNTWLYVMAQRGGGWAIKIGLATDPRTRVQQVQTGSPLPLYLAHTVGPMTAGNARTLERLIHDVYARQRMCGEWFRMESECGARILDAAWDEVQRRRSMAGAQ
jgi:hypothetical protein